MGHDHLVLFLFISMYRFSLIRSFNRKLIMLFLVARDICNSGCEELRC